MFILRDELVSSDWTGNDFICPIKRPDLSPQTKLCYFPKTLPCVILWESDFPTTAVSSLAIQTHFLQSQPPALNHILKI